MNNWTNDELTKINQADELQISTVRKDGTLRKHVTIWVVRINNDLYIRAVKGQTGKWYQHAVEQHLGHIQAGGVSKDVIFVEANEDTTETVDEAYQAKYNGYGESIVGSTMTIQARAATLKLTPRKS
jgi:hypothetical protein